MPSTQGLAVLVRGTKLGWEDWLNLVKARHNMIKPRLDRFTLPELGDLECLQRYVWDHSLREDGPKFPGKEGFSLKTQGVFSVQPYEAEELSPGRMLGAKGIKRIWGLLRSGEWVVGKLEYVLEAGHKGQGYERAKVLTIKKTSLEQLIEETKEKPEVIWRKLGLTIKEWEESRKRLYEEALALARIVESEEEAVELIARK